MFLKTQKRQTVGVLGLLCITVCCVSLCVVYLLCCCVSLCVVYHCVLCITVCCALLCVVYHCVLCTAVCCVPAVCCGVSEDDLCWLQLEDFRMLLIKNIEPSRITPYLRQCQVITAEDEEQLFNDPTLVVRRRKVGALLDILQRTGVKGHTAFLESLELDYPQLYSRITGKEPNKTFSILIDTAGESGLTQFLMSELSRLQRALQEERRRRQQACSAAKDQEAWSQQQQLRERELRKLSERVQKLREERERLSEEVKQLRDHNYSLMSDLTCLGQEKSAALLANRDLQIEVERLKHTLLRAKSHTWLLRRRTQRPLQESRSLAPPTDVQRCPSEQEEVREEKQEEQREEPREEQREEQREESPAPAAAPPMNLLATVFRLRRDLHRAEEQRARAMEEQEEQELRCTQLKGDVRVYRQRNKQTLRQLEEVMRERDKALSWRAEQQEEVRVLLQEKDQYREQVRQLTEQSDRVELLLLRSQGAELQLRARLRRFTFDGQQVGVYPQCVRSSAEEGEEPTEDPTKAGSSEEVRSGTSGENEEAVLQQLSASVGGASAAEQKHSSVAPWGEEPEACWTSRTPPNFFYRRKRAVRSKLCSRGYAAGLHDDSSEISDSD
ncbi:caspase recruitment domain-containing protein 9 isoform X3 [Nelusetta ayraudi]|uniref:caspase recruitment domain-containing protein 9 isoform X3 n=1 Tax=Nelusetta ayraudi TaxID=303726 RepID=UPI003F6F32DD